MEIKWGKKPTVDKTKQGYHRSQLSNHARVSQLPSALGPFPRHSGTRTMQKHSPPSPPSFLHLPAAAPPSVDQPCEQHSRLEPLARTIP